ncbi:hypothetical protein, partial [uncultured Endozoicomonas sp.]|uniref:hypothetical protein n=1 Tax=uncultured Endozoicomonas sp. TaxID=432652 RepID=UPI00260C6E5C
MTNPFFHPYLRHSSHFEAYSRLMLCNRLTGNDWAQQNSSIFGRQVHQTTPIYYLNTSIPCNESIHHPCRDSSFKKGPVKVIHSQESKQSEPLDLSQKSKACQIADQNTPLFTRQSELRIDRVWSMAGESSFHSHSINANHPALASMSKYTSGNSVFGLKQSTSQSSSVADNNVDRSVEFFKQYRIDTYSKPPARVANITPQLNRAQLQQNTFPAGNQFDFNASASGSSESLTVHPDKAHVQPEKRKASKRTWAQSEKRKAAQQAWAQSEKGKAYAQSKKRKAAQQAWAQSEKGKASKRTWAQSEKGKAYAQSEKRKASQKAWAQSEKGKACKKAYAQSEKRKASQKAWA